MKSTETLEAITSSDSHQAWLSSWEIIRTPVDELQSFYLPHIKTIRAAVRKLPKPEGTFLRDSRDISELAVKILETIASGQCRCLVYPSTDQLLPEDEEKHGFIEIQGKKDIPWEPEFSCKCNECGKTYIVKENHGYHYPWAEWTYRKP